MPRDWSIRVALLLVSIMSIQTISLGGGTILGVPPQGLVDSEQNEEIDNGRSEKIYVNFQIDALSDLNGASITIYDLGGAPFVFEFDTTGGGGFDESSRVVLVYEIGTINGTVEEFSSMVDSLAWFDAEVVSENVVKISSIPEGDLIDAWASSPTEEISISIAQGVDPHVLPGIRELFRVPVIGPHDNSQLLVRHFLASQEGDFVFIGRDYDRFDTTDCYQGDDYAESFIAVFDSAGVCSWVMKIRANIFDAGLINDSIMIFAEAYDDLTILGNDIQSSSWFFGSIGLDGIWRNVFSAPRSSWDYNSMYEIQDNHKWFNTLVVEEGMIIHMEWNDLADVGPNNGVSISGCTGSYYAAKITPEGACIDQFNGSGSRWNAGLTRTGDGKLWNVWGYESHSMTSDFENYSYHQFTPYSGDVDITGISGEFPLSALGSKIASGSQYCTEGYEGSTYTAISHDKGIYIGSVVNDPDNYPDFCPLGMFLVDHSEMSLEIVAMGENTRFSSPCTEEATNCVGIVQFGDGFCLVPGDRWGGGGWNSGENGWRERVYDGGSSGSGDMVSSTYFSETCFDSNWEIDWTFGHSESLTGNPYCTAETGESGWDVDETILYDPFDDYSEVQGVDGALLRVKVVNYRNCNNGNGVHSYHEIIVQAIDPPSKVDNDNDGIFDLHDHCPGTGFGRVVDGLGCAWEQADDDGDGFTNLIESQCDTLTNNSSSTPIDIDGDGTCDYLDNDYDGDGVINSEDAFPGDPTEWGDADGDGIGDNSDEDADGDGLDDSWRDTDEDGYYDHEDAFPYDPNEWSDRDGDGIGDNSDDEPDGVDDDSDGGGADGDSEDDSGTDTQGDGELGNDDGGMSGNSGSADGANSDATQVDPGIQNEGGSDEVGSDSLWSTACGLVGFFVFIGIGYNRRVNALKSEIRVLRDQLDSPNYRR